MNALITTVASRLKLFLHYNLMGFDSRVGKYLDDA